VKSASIVKNTRELRRLYAKCEEAQQKLDAAKYQKRVSGEQEGLTSNGYTPMMMQGEDSLEDDADTHGSSCACCACCQPTKQEKMEKIQEELLDWEKQCEQERVKVLKESRDYRSHVNATCGFVEFADRRDVQVALKLNVTEDENEWIMEAPPDPCDVRYEDLAKNPAMLVIQGIVGYGLMAVLFLCNGLFVGGVEEWAKWLQKCLSEHVGPFESILEALAETLGLLILWSYLPTLIRMILDRCFMIASNCNVQHRIQRWYFLHADLHDPRHRVRGVELARQGR